MYRLWANDPVSCVSLCMLSQKFKLASKILQVMSVSTLEMDSLIHLSQISKMIDMPHYSFVRMQLLYPERFPDLVQILRGIMMLLP